MYPIICIQLYTYNSNIDNMYIYGRITSLLLGNSIYAVYYFYIPFSSKKGITNGFQTL